MFPAMVSMPDEFTVFTTTHETNSAAAVGVPGSGHTAVDAGVVTQLCSTRTIACGATFISWQGSPRMCQLLDPLLPSEDLRWRIGGEEHWQPFMMAPTLPFLPSFFPTAACRFLRRCSWVRFLTLTEDKKLANLILIRQNPPTFQTTQQINAGEILRLHTDRDLINGQSRQASPVRAESPAATYPSVFSFQEKKVNNLDSILHKTLERLMVSSSPKCFTTSGNLSDVDGSSAKDRKHLCCSFCGKKFDRPSLLQRHERVHTGDKPFHCDLKSCGKSFSTSSSLNTHKRTHTGEKPHGCQECGKRFTASSNLYYHRMTHTKERPHKCPICHKGLTTPGDLKNHLYTHNNSWPFKCDICHKGYSKANQLKSHQKSHHKDT